MPATLAWIFINLGSRDQILLTRFSSQTKIVSDPQIGNLWPRRAGLGFFRETCAEVAH